MPSVLNIRTPSDFDLARDVCSYGYFLLSPNLWDPHKERFLRVLELDDGPASAVITQSGSRSGSGTRSDSVRVRFDRTLSRAEQTQARAQIVRMLSLDVDTSEVREFHKVDPRWKRSGRARLVRSPTLFEDVIKTVTSCNVTWTSTIHMNLRLCEVSGRRAPSGARSFPSAKKLARTRPQTLRGRCRVGYRDTRIVEIAKIFARGGVDEHWLHNDASDEDAFAFLLTLPGIGPYAAGNIMQLMGRYSRLALDSESIRHAKNVLMMKGTDAQLMKELAAHYEPFGNHKFRSYWFELWDFYESKAGPAPTWERDKTASVFTASNLAPKKATAATRKKARDTKTARV